MPDTPFALPDDVLERLITPALVVSVDAARHNIARVIAAARGDAARWRPHLKTTKSALACRLLAAAGVRHAKCATTRELALALDTFGPDADLLVAHPLVGPALARVAALADAHPDARVAILVEAPDALADLPRSLDVFIDVNPGMNRTGHAVDRLDDLRALARAAGPRLRGIHFYDGHLAGLDAPTRRARAHGVYDDLLALVARLRADGIGIAEIITSGTPTFPDALAYAPFDALDGAIHRISPGTVVYHDTRTEQELPNLGLRPAAVVLTRVVSHPAPDRVTCDAGSKSIAAEVGDPCAVVLGRPDLVAARPSEEHLPLDVRAGAVPGRGDVLCLVPAHVCPTVNLYDTMVVVESGREPRLEPIAARGHETWLR
ncbi:MAG: alanine racemase [Phycisphaerales bacterium]|nr:alanine racemase [Phycisphaerales bacterium]